ncbi:hypothetical protein NEIMUCOT_05985 [Neisseria mucosa ATCC 25996]|uniref:Uncharacterized protein n=1 Tax=Neisseria mucosa (strain ATCC 25996 / DSM 4631 / NCTC 10774 / M26) TaxID=546266 RepID=D2ZZB0_NEIM2|nr:hypothetical protein NEIMUCOT_05985 [Neisseria mucosa ATCC 25996]
MAEAARQLFSRFRPNCEPTGFQTTCNIVVTHYSGLNLNQDKATKPQTVQIVRQGEATPYWFKVNPLYKPNI